MVAIEPLGLELPMFDITTGTGDFVAGGVVNHNCFARPTHEFLGMNTGEDFDRRIVVKINAVERVRAELSPGRWAGDHIAMGTNTDPYQRCEAKYRLTQGIVGELSAAANPFSILTKSTLILRDLDILAEAARRTDVRANFSIGTLDEEVWRVSEPGTPHPLRRIEAVAKLNEAGVPCGVLVAPVLPDLSDAPDQLDAVVKACVDAGAVSITPLLLHLRAGVREHYLEWLAGARPDLLDHYAGMYPAPTPRAGRRTSWQHWCGPWCSATVDDRRPLAKRAPCVPIRLRPPRRWPVSCSSACSTGFRSTTGVPSTASMWRGRRGSTRFGRSIAGQTAPRRHPARVARQ